MNDSQAAGRVATNDGGSDRKRRFLLDLADCVARATQLRLALDGMLANGKLPARAAHEMRVVALAAHDQMTALLMLQGVAGGILNADKAEPGPAETARLH